MLFLGVAGALTIGVLAGSGLAINQQRYRDSVNSVKSFIQEQYSEVTNVVNGRSGAEACANAVVTDSEDAASSQSRGTSECVLLGRYVTLSENGQQIVASNVVGYRTSGAKEENSDIEEINENYNLGISTIDQDTFDVPWGATIVKARTTGASQPLALSMLILRSPLSGAIMTYTHESDDVALNAIVAVENANIERNLCLDMSGNVTTGNRMAVQISKFATNQGAIQIPPEYTAICD